MRPEHFVSPLSLYPLPLHACIEKKSVWRDHTVCHDMRLGNASAACAKKNGDSGRREDQAAVEGKVFLSFPVLSFETFHVLLWGWGGEGTYSCLLCQADIANSRWGGEIFFIAEPLVQAQGRQEDFGQQPRFFSSQSQQNLC